MFQSRLNNLVEPHAPRERSVFNKLRISCHAFQMLAGTVDILVVSAATAAGGILYETLCPSGDALAQDLLLSGATMGLLYVYIGSMRGLYTWRALAASRSAVNGVFPAWAAVALLAIASLVVLQDRLNAPLGAVIAALPAQIAGLLTARFLLVRAAEALLAERSLSGRRVVTIGEPTELLGLSPGFLLQCFGLTEVCRVAVGTSLRLRPAEVMADVDRAVAAAQENGAEEFLLALDWGRRELLERIIAGLRASPLPVRLLPDRNIRTIHGQFDSSRDRDAFPLRVQKAGLSACENAIKRSIDLIGAGTALFLLWPIFLIAAIAIKLDSKGPLIFRQKRAGLNGKEFVIYKFRTMTVLEDGPNIKQACRDDHRVTRVGRFLRRSSIDELPQLFNVLKGDMALVGPRPHAIAHDSEYKILIADYSFRHHVKPGVTGWAQVNGLRGETASLRQMAEPVEMDQWYINNWSIGLDIKILVRTCFEVLRQQAY